MMRAWCRSRGYDAAAARLRALAPDPLPPMDEAALLAALELTAPLGEQAGTEEIMRAISVTARDLPDEDRAALTDAANQVLDSLYP